ncbi:protein folded gastrulation [Bactrocera neohumeralis]|uniref:protein folded gastrulation n=1 Tax=Bactrocera neohumeralis TaxID=98809 RepID=UPI0021659A49|nr:protein folded gastrulation [Bactrocera neohumeralis]XP_050327937.1 protein folded gastrulation [Bactrocera neohumeralis]XP_050327938.1 protein folded gastrulation [Bactrocera neohumeralis]XP_050327939.1 protein folded gastrulation [Bactrocera neohumeralis]
MITRIQAIASRVITTTPTCNGSKSRAMQHHTKTANSTTITTTTTIAGQMQKHMTTNTLDATTMIAATATMRARRAATTWRRCSMAALQVLVLVCALPPPLQPLRLSTQRWAGAVEALPITSKPIEGTAENLAWQEWLMLPAEQKQLEKSRKVTPKSIFSLPFRDCPPGHQLFQSRCIPTVNINQSDLLTQQVLGLFGGSNAGAAGADTAYEIDYGDEEYDLGLGEGEPVMMYETPPQPFNGGLVVGASNTQQPPARDEPLKFNLFQQKFPTNDYEADISTGAMEGSGAARPLTELLAANGSKGERAGVAGNDNDVGATLFNSTQFLDAVQGFFQRNVATAQSDSNATIAAETGSNANITDHNTRAVNGSQALADLSAADSNVPAFSDGDIDAIILPAVGAGTTAKTIGGYAGGDLEPQRISLFKDDSSVHLVTTVIAQAASVDRAGGAEEDAVAGDLVAAAQQQENSIAHFLRADALLPLSSVAPYITTTTTTTATTPYTHDAGHAPKTSSMSAKDEHPRSVTALKASTAANDTDAQETSFITTTEPEGTTNFQIDETTVIEAQDADAVAAESNLSLLQTIAQQQQLELEKSKATAVEDVPSTTLVTGTVEDETTVAGDKTTTQTETIINETTTTTTLQNASEESAETADTTVQPLPSADVVSGATTTPQANSASTYRFRHTPTVATAAVTPIQLPARSNAADKQVPSLVTTVVPQTVEILAGEEATTRVSADSALVNDVPRSGNNTDNDDLVNVVAASINSDTDNDSNKYKNVAAHNHNRPAEAASVTRDVNIAQELRMINELVKGNRQASATKIAATKTTETAATATTIQSTTISTPPSAKAPVEEEQKAASAADYDQHGSASGAEAVELGEDVDATTTTAAETATQVADASALNESSLPAESSSETVATTTMPETAQLLSLTKMESANQSAESATAENAPLSESSSKKRAGVETHTSAEPDFETEATATDTEFMAATTLWSRIMPIFGFGGSTVVAEANAPAVTTPTTTTTTTTEVAEHTPVGSISSNSSSIRSSSKSKNSLSEKSSIMEKNNNNNNIINNQKSDFDTPSRRNSKIIRIDHFSDNSVAAATAATTTNTLEDTAATITKTTDDFVIVPEEHEPMEQSAYWWLPANWRLNRGTTTEEQPLLFRLWSAFPESQMKTKVRT